MECQWFLRDAKEEDAKKIMLVHIDCINKVCSQHYSKDQLKQWVKRQSLQRYSVFIQQDNDFIVVLRQEAKSEDSVVVAFGHMGKKTEGLFSDAVDFEVYGFYVSPDVSRRGVGKLLFRELERRALEQGGCGIGVVSTLNAVPFYEACGFKVTRDYFHGDLQLESKCMEVKLSH